MKKLLTLLVLVVSGHFLHAMVQQSLNSIYFTGASVLPITHFEKIDATTGKMHKVRYVVLSRESGGSDRGTWDAFGGSRDSGETHPVVTAAREFYEEAMAADTLKMSNEEVLKYIDLSHDNTEMVFARHTDNHGPKGAPRYFVSYITNFKTSDINALRANFWPAHVHARGSFREKDGIAVVRWDELEQVIKTSRSNSCVQVMAREFDFRTQKDKPTKTLITLRPLLVKSLRPYFENQNYAPGNSPKIRFYS